MNARKLIRVSMLAFLGAGCGEVHAFDILRAEQAIPETAAGSMVTTCVFLQTPARPLRLAEAIERALCNNPKTRAAWAMVKAQAAGVGVARAAYLPTISANWQGVRENTVSDIENHPTLSSDIDATVRTASVSLNWILYDFGGRETALKNANALLDAALATHDANLQIIFARTAKDYYASQTAIGQLRAAKELEAMTRRSMLAAQERSDKGVAPISDAFQAQTQHEQSVLSLTKAESDAQTMLGTLASDMNLEPGVPLEVLPVSENARIDQSFSQSIEEMIREVQTTHPSVRAAQAQYEAAVAKIAQTRAQGLPSISLVAKYSQNNQPQSLGLGLATYSANGHDAYIGVQVSIPLFEGFGRNYQVDQASAEAERQADALDDAKRQAALDVWTSYQTLTEATRNAENTAKLLNIAERSWQASWNRYDAGVGTILELLNTQTALASAKQRRVQAMADWDNARLDLASKLGTLRLTDIE